MSEYNSVMVLGPTAVGKTALSVRIADWLGGEILSADSRQVYKKLDIGSGKDLCEFTLHNPERLIPYHLIDITDLSQEFSVYDYQKAFYSVFPQVLGRNTVPVICGGTGMYLDSVVRGYELLKVPCNAELRKTLEGKSDIELVEYLKDLKKGKLHNTTDTTEHHRLLRAIEIETYIQENASNSVEKASLLSDTESTRPDIRLFIIGTTFPRDVLRSGIKKRLLERVNEGLIEEVNNLHESGITWNRLERLGLEYRFVSEYLQKSIDSKEQLIESLYRAIGQFAKRQETWFRRMEKQGVKIHWLNNTSPETYSLEYRFSEAKQVLVDAGFIGK